MKRNIKLVCMLAILICSQFSLPAADKKKTMVLATTFPIYQITRNIARDIPGVKVSLLLPPNMGCPHDYTLVPRDMRKLAEADILVVNGLGMEEFLGAPVTKANSSIKIIDSSAGIKNLLEYAPFEQEKGHESAEHAEKEGKHHHHHTGINPHLFASPAMSAQLGRNIAAALAQYAPEFKKQFALNAEKYAARMQKLADKFASLGKKLKNNRIVTQHGAFDYLARDAGLKVVAVVQAHGGAEPSASTMLSIIRRIKKEKAGAVFTEPQYSAKVASTIAEEAGIPCSKLDPCANGAVDAPLDYYDKVMLRNLETLRKTLGIKGR